MSRSKAPRTRAWLGLHEQGVVGAATTPLVLLSSLEIGLKYGILAQFREAGPKTKVACLGKAPRSSLLSHGLVAGLYTYDSVKVGVSG